MRSFLATIVRVLFGIQPPYPCFGETVWEREYRLAFEAHFRAPCHPDAPTVITCRR